MRDHNPKNAISLKNLKIRQIRRFFPGVAVFPNLGTNYPEVGPLEKNTSLQRLYSDSLSQYDWGSCLNVSTFLHVHLIVVFTLNIQMEKDIVLNTKRRLGLGLWM